MSRIIDTIHIFVRRRKFIVYFVLAVVILTLLISLLVPNQYRAEATILPPNPERDAMMGLIFASVPSGIAGITGAGGLLGGPTASDLYANIMKSRVIMDKIIEKYQLKREFKTRTLEDAYKSLLSITNIIVTPEGIITVTVMYKNKKLAANVANSFVEELDRFNTETAMTAGKKYRLFIEQRLKETIDAMANAEDSLRSFQEKHKTVALNEEIQSAIQTIAQLKSQIIMKEVQRGAMASNSSTMMNPYVANIDQELAQLRIQLSKIEFGGMGNTNEFGAGFSMPFAKLPELSMEYARLLRDVKVQEAIYELMIQQYEQAKIMELKDTPTVQFLDRAVPPEKKSFPKRGILLLTVFFLSLLMALFLSFIMERIDMFKKNKPDEYAKWTQVYVVLKNDFLKAKRRIFKKKA
jgi:tyrosine-protein kinase Etk/Wzc